MMSFAGTNDSVTITRIHVAGDQAALEWQGGTAPYRFQWRTNSSSGWWAYLGAAVSGTNRTSNVSASNASFRIVADGTPPRQNARYRVTLDATWSRQTHPMQFPGNAHSSGLIGGTHSAQFTMWAPGMVATDEIELMAESGVKTTLAAEVNFAITAGAAQYVISGSGPDSPGSYSMEFDIGRSFPLVSLVSMIAPSPDLFVGVRDLDLCLNGTWGEQLVFSLQPYDAGTDSGVSYGSLNADMDPVDPISQITGFSFESNVEVARLGSFTFQWIDNQ